MCGVWCVSAQVPSVPEAAPGQYSPLPSVSNRLKASLISATSLSVSPGLSPFLFTPPPEEEEEEEEEEEDMSHTGGGLISVRKWRDDERKDRIASVPKGPRGGEPGKPGEGPGTPWEGRARECLGRGPLGEWVASGADSRRAAPPRHALPPLAPAA